MDGEGFRHFLSSFSKLATLGTRLPEYFEIGQEMRSYWVLQAKVLIF
jgi:hypothetical protein